MQSKRHALLEAITNQVVGNSIAMLVYYLMGIGIWQSLGLQATFLVLSIIRSYVIRRVFNRMENAND